jgi:hypothetical protein
MMRCIIFWPGVRSGSHKRTSVLGRADAARLWDAAVDRLLAIGFTDGAAHRLADQEVRFDFAPVLAEEHQANRDDAVECLEWPVGRWEQRSSERGAKNSSTSEEFSAARLVPEREHFGDREPIDCI